MLRMRLTREAWRTFAAQITGFGLRVATQEPPVPRSAPDPAALIPD